VQFAKSDFGLVFGSVLQKNCGFWFGFSFTKLTAVSVFFRVIFYILMSTPSFIYAFVVWH